MIKPSDTFLCLLLIRHKNRVKDKLIWRNCIMADSLVVAAFVVGKVLKYTFKAIAAIYRLIKGAAAAAFRASKNMA